MKKRSNLKGLLLLCSMAFCNVPFLGLICPPASGACFAASAAMGALAVVGAATGPVGWGLWGLCTLWGA